MAYPNEIQIGRLNAVLYKLLDMKEGAPAPQLTGEVVPGLVLESDRIEWKFLGGERIMAGRATPGAAAGEITAAQLLNPAGSEVLIILEACVFSTSSNTGVLFGFTQADIGSDGSLTASSRDTRVTPLTGNVGVGRINGVTQVGSAITGPIVGDLYGLANTPMRYPGQVVLAPNMGFVAETGSANIAVRSTWIWRERRLEMSETR